MNEGSLVTDRRLLTVSDCRLPFPPIANLQPFWIFSVDIRLTSWREVKPTPS